MNIITLKALSIILKNSRKVFSKNSRAAINIKKSCKLL